MGRWIRIPKGNGKTRRIYVPDPHETHRLRALLPDALRPYRRAQTALARSRSVPLPELLRAVHGFLPGRSPVTAALPHVGMALTLSFDLEEFFDHVTEERVRTVLRLAGINPPAWLAEAFRDGIAAQGLPTSPLLSNLAFLPADLDILAATRRLHAPQHGPAAAYTRYADDIAVSLHPATAGRVLQPVQREVERAVAAAGFRINRDKTRVHASHAGRRTVFGVLVGPDGIHPPRRLRKKLRAAIHQGNTASASGLSACTSLLLPRRAALSLAGATLTHCSLARPCGPDCRGGADTLRTARRSVDGYTLTRVILLAKSLASRTSCPGQALAQAFQIRTGRRLQT